MFVMFTVMQYALWILCIKLDPIELAKSVHFFHSALWNMNQQQTISKEDDWTQL